MIFSTRQTSRSTGDVGNTIFFCFFSCFLEQLFRHLSFKMGRSNVLFSFGRAEFASEILLENCGRVETKSDMLHDAQIHNQINRRSSPIKEKEAEVRHKTRTLLEVFRTARCVNQRNTHLYRSQDF